MKLFSKLPLTILIALGINACGGGSNSNSLTPSLTGTAQKGSYLIDSSVSFSQLSAQGAITSKSAKTTITNNLGKFATDLSWNDWTKITVSGLYFNEFTGTNSKTALTLKSITDVGTSSGDININLFTHLIAARIQKLTNTGKSLSASKQQALKELKILLDFDTKKIEKLNIGENNKRGNAVLLLFSAGFLSSTPDDNKRSARLLNLADDFADNGLLDGKAKTLFKAIATYAGKPNVFALLTPNLKKKGYKNPPSAKTLGKLPTWLILDKSKNRLPIANAGNDKTITVGEKITLQGKGTDSDGTIKSYQWTQNNKILSNSATLKLNNLLVGNYTYILTVTDNKGAKGKTSVTIHVKEKNKANKKPNANAGHDKTITAGKSITLNGSKSTDSDGTIKSYQWTEKGKVVGNTAILKRNKLLAGKYTYILTVIDNKGAKDTDSITITVKAKLATNTPPIAKAGKDQTLTEGEKITLNGSSSSDPDGTIKSYQWTKKGKVVGNAATLKRDKLLVGKYTYTLTVTDNKGAKDTDSITITVKEKPITNEAPTARAGENQTITAGESITLNGSSSSDPDGTIKSYRWTKRGKVVGNAATLKLDKLLVGKYTYTLTVTDNKGAKDTDSITITVKEKPIANETPTARAGENQTIIAGESITLNGSNSTDSDGTIKSYQWMEKGKVVGNAATLKRDKLLVGKYTYTLTVTDNKGAKGTDRITITVTEKSATNKPPIAKAGNDQTITEGEKITLNGSSSSDPDGTITAYQWTQSGKVLSNSVTLKRDNLSVGEYIYTLTVTDNKGAKSSDSITIRVNAKPVSNQPPIANAGQDKTITQGQSITLIGTGTDPDGTISAYQWTQGATILSNTSTLERNNLPAGSYTYTLTVTDNKGAKNTDTVTLTVKAATTGLPTIKVNMHENLCTTAGGMHLRLESTVTGGVTGQGPLHITRYTGANCSGSETALPSFIPSDTTAAYTITNITNSGGGRRTGTMYVSALGQTRASAVNIDVNGNVTR